MRYFAGKTVGPADSSVIQQYPAISFPTLPDLKTRVFGERVLLRQFARSETAQCPNSLNPVASSLSAQSPTSACCIHRAYR
jgi:hypothetical protein